MTAIVTKLDGSQEKWVDPRPHLIKIWRDRYKEVRKFEPTLGYGAMMNMMYHKFEPMDEKTSECFIEYPEEEAWKMETAGFFKNDFAKKTNYFFGFFLKQYGSFTVVAVQRKDGTWKREEPVPIQAVQHLFDKIGGPMEVEKKATDPNERFRCPECNEIHARGFKCANQR